MTTRQNFQMPFFLKIDKGLLNNFSKILDNLVSNEKLLFITDSIVYNLYGKIALNQLEKITNNISIELINSNNIEESFSLVKRIIYEDITSIVGMGGGKVLDVCKYASFMSKTKFFSIPTAIAHDGIASPIAVLKTPKGVKSLGCIVPSGIIIDLDIIKNSPLILRKAGVGDTLSNVTAILDWELAAKKNKETINDFALLLSDTSVNAILNFRNKDLDDIDFLKQLSESIILSGLAMNLAGSSRPCSGAEHLLSHSMDRLERNNLHGIQVAVSSLITASLHNIDIKPLREFLQKFNIPYRLEDLGFTEDEFIDIFLNARSTRPNRYTILDETDLSEKNIRRIYKLFNN
jgi:glycerol-1-phosphate dehydrogenase [NAD(P)+]